MSGLARGKKSREAERSPTHQFGTQIKAPFDDVDVAKRVLHLGPVKLGFELKERWGIHPEHVYRIMVLLENVQSFTVTFFLNFRSILIKLIWIETNESHQSAAIYQQHNNKIVLDLLVLVV